MNKSKEIEQIGTGIEAILLNDDSQFEWCLVATEVDDEVAYITVRGFGFAKSCIELYKQAQHKTMQKIKALPSELCPKW